jgi:ethanolamine utilization microcompartment shell protein EutS
LRFLRRSSSAEEPAADHRLRLEVGREPETQTCQDCGRVQVLTDGFIYLDDDAYAIYFATLLMHEAVRADLAIGIGTWAEGETAAISAFLTVSVRADEIQFGFTDAANSTWGGAHLLTHPLAAADARRDPAHRDILALAELVVRDDPAVAAHLS